MLTAFPLTSIRLCPGDEVLVRERARSQLRIKDALVLASSAGFPDWVEVDAEKMKGRLKSLPERASVAQDINESLIIELYSR